MLIRFGYVIIVRCNYPFLFSIHQSTSSFVTEVFSNNDTIPFVFKDCLVLVILDFNAITNSIFYYLTSFINSRKILPHSNMFVDNMVKASVFVSTSPNQINITYFIVVKHANQITCLVRNKKIKGFLDLSSELVINIAKITHTYRLWIYNIIIFHHISILLQK